MSEVRLDTGELLSIAPEALDGEVARTLIATLDEELDGRYPEPGANHFRLDQDEVAPGRGAFLVARIDGQPVGCGALRKLDESTGELKRMLVLSRWRGRRIGQHVLQALEEHARELGLTHLVLETGYRQGEAITLYQRAGYVQIPLFGEYLDADPTISLCMGKDLGPSEN